MRGVVKLNKSEAQVTINLLSELSELRTRYSRLADEIKVAESKLESHHKVMSDKYGLHVGPPHSPEFSDCGTYLLGYWRGDRK